MRLNKRESDAIRKRVSEMNDELMELGCDSTQIVVTIPLVGDNWGRTSLGKGNLYARIGAVNDWISTQDGIVLAHEIACATSGDDFEDF